MTQIWNWYYRRASIRTKLVISYLILVLLPIFGLGFYSYHISTENLLEQTRQAVEENLSLISSSINDKIQRENDNIKYLSYNVRFRERLRDGMENVTGLADELTKTVEPVFWYFISSDENIKGIKIYSPYIRNGIGSFLKPLDEYEKKEWYENNNRDFKTHWFHEDARIYITRILLDAHTSSQPIGIMSLEVFPDRFAELINQTEFLNNGVLLVEPATGIVSAKHIRNAELEEELLSKVSGGVRPGSYETERYLMSVSQELLNGWQLVYFLDKVEISEQMRKILISTIQLMFVWLIVVTTLISLLSRLLSSRILKLKNQAEQVSHGNFEVDAPEDSADEIGIVETSFVKMSRRIHDMMEEMYTLGLEKRAEELKALQAMINPHFLYNCLSSIKWKAILAEQDEIANVTGLVARFYRTTLNEGKQITTVAKELENIKSYLEIQSRMHDGDFDIDYILDENGQDFEMPNFILQPIVENAICHGIAYCEEGERGFIRIEYLCKDNYLIFNVYNNGSKVDREKLEKTLAVPGKGYGLYNIKERIRMFYPDDACGLYNCITADGLVCFTVRLGVRPEKKDVE